MNANTRHYANYMTLPFFVIGSLYGIGTMAMLVDTVLRGRWPQFFSGSGQFVFWWGSIAVALCSYLLWSINHNRKLVKQYDPTASWPWWY
jgi:predicted signal transduction protein with EAL and GGDEF domain